MKKTLYFFPPFVIVLVGILLWASSVSSYSVDNRSLQKSIRESLPQGPQPKAVVDDPEYSFGTMDPLSTGTHEFTIRNEGDGPLTLREGTTTCKCTVGSITRKVIPPGETGGVRLTWNTGRKHPVYAHGATILTDDYRTPRIELHVTGLVRMQVSAEPIELIHPQVKPDRPSVLSTTVFSQVWDDFEVEEATCSLDGATWKVGQTDTETIEQLNAKSAKHISLTLPPGMPEGFFRGTLNLRLRPSSAEEAVDLELMVSGKVLRRLAIYGAEFSEDDSIDLGKIPVGQGKEATLLMKVRDEQPDLGAPKVTASHEFLRASVTPYKGTSGTAGLYHLNIEVAPEAPACSFLAGEPPQLHIEVEHPRIAPLDIGVRFAVQE